MVVDIMAVGNVVGMAWVGYAAAVCAVWVFTNPGSVCVALIPGRLQAVNMNNARMIRNVVKIVFDFMVFSLYMQCSCARFKKKSMAIIMT